MVTFTSSSTSCRIWIRIATSRWICSPYMLTTLYRNVKSKYWFNAPSRVTKCLFSSSGTSLIMDYLLQGVFAFNDYLHRSNLFREAVRTWKPLILPANLHDYIMFSIHSRGIMGRLWTWHRGKKFLTITVIFLYKNCYTLDSSSFNDIMCLFCHNTRFIRPLSVSVSE